MTTTTTTAEQIRERAVGRAMSEGIQVFLLDPERWAVTSHSHPGQAYEVHGSQGCLSCTCLGYTYRQSCKHVEAVRLTEAA